MTISCVVRVTEDCEGQFFAQRFWEREWRWWTLAVMPLPASVVRGPFATQAEAEKHADELRSGHKVLAEWRF